VLAEAGRRIRALRIDAGLSAEQLGHATGLDRTYVTSVERGERNVGLLNLVRFCTALNTNPADVVSDLKLGQKRR
jgi:transcriptional regulator with XRE-family HTH domain